MTALISTKNRQLVLLLLAVAGFFAAYCIGVVTREPYPAPFFPGFGSIPTDEDIQPVRVRRLAFESSEGRETLAATEAFDGAFDSFHPQMLDSLQRAESPGPGFTEWANSVAMDKLGWPCTDSVELIETVTDGSEPERVLNRFPVEGCTS